MKKSGAKKSEIDLLTIPKTVFETAQSKEDLEDWLLSHNPEFVDEMRRIREEEDLAGQGISLEKAARQWHIKL